MIYHLRHPSFCLLIDFEIIHKIKIQVLLHFIFIINIAFALVHDFLDLRRLPIIMNQWHISWDLYFLGIWSLLNLILWYIKHIQY